MKSKRKIASFFITALIKIAGIILIYNVIHNILVKIGFSLDEAESMIISFVIGYFLVESKVILE